MLLRCAISWRFVRNHSQHCVNKGSMAAADAHGGAADGILLLEKLPLDRAEKLLNELGAALSGKQKKGPEQNQYTELSATDFHKSTQALIDLFRAHCLTQNQNSTELVPLGILSTPYREKIRQIVLRNKDDLRAYFQRGEAIPKKVLRNFDWQALVVAASNQLASQETPLLRLSLNFDSFTGLAESSQDSIEFTLPELDTIIDELKSSLFEHYKREIE